MLSAVSVAVVLGLTEVATRLIDEDILRSLVILAIAGTGCAVVLRLWTGVGNSHVRELNAGYTTFRLTFGGFWWGEPRSWPGFHRRAPWVYDGVWVLDPATGEVVQRPDGVSTPPGFYPSPHRTGMIELWSGAVWTGHYREVDGARSVRAVVDR